MTRRPFSLLHVCASPLKPTSAELELLIPYALDAPKSQDRMEALGIIACAGYDHGIIDHVARHDVDEVVRQKAISWLSNYDQQRALFRAARSDNPFGRSEGILENAVQAIVTTIYADDTASILLNTKQTENLGLSIWTSESALLYQRTLVVGDVLPECIRVEQSSLSNRGCGVKLSAQLASLCDVSYDQTIDLKVR